MYKCDCYDFSNGHICKHLHRVHTMVEMKSVPDGEKEAESPETDNSDEEMDYTHTLIPWFLKHLGG